MQKIIITHKNTDFDALGSLVAAKLLYPDFTPILGHIHTKRVEEFIRLHKDFLNFTSPKNVDWIKVKEVILVDFQDFSRGEGIENIENKDNIKWIIYDHHPEQKFDAKPFFKYVQEIGSTSTILCKYLIEKNINPDFLTATIIALGIYADTGKFTYPNTKPQDLEMASWLLKNGADLNIISEYTTLTLQENHFELSNDLMSNSEIINYGSLKILLSYSVSENYIHDLYLISHKLSEYYSVDSIILVVKMQKNIYIIARSNSSHFNLLEILKEYNPKGHYQAVFVKLKDCNIENIIDNLKNKIKSYSFSNVFAKDIMSSPVRTINKNMEINKANELLLRYGHNGFVVIDDNKKVVGIITRRDIDKALHHNMGKSLVKDFMSSNIVSIDENTEFNKIEELMINKNMGRFPVLRNGNLVGIVTRTDILKTLYSKEIKQNIYSKLEPVSNINLKEKMKSYFTKEQFEFLNFAGKEADKLGYKIFLVGGGVRDLILDNNKKDIDIDIVVEINHNNDATDFAKHLSKLLNCKLIIHDKYRTAKLKLPFATIDVATARTEFYEFSASSPSVDFSTIKQDLYRRDFTINALAVSLNSSNFGYILDFFNGYEDIQIKTLKILHNFSFVEDPNRIFRLVRFSSKLGFNIDSETKKIAINTMNLGRFDCFINDRIKNEIKIIFTNQYNPVKNIKILDDLNSLRFFSKDVKYKNIEKKLIRLYKYINFIKKYYPNINIKEWLIYLMIIFNEIKNNEEYEKIISLFRFEKEEEKSIKDTRRIDYSINWRELADSDIYFFWKKFSTEVLIYSLAFNEDRVLLKSLFKYWFKLKNIKLNIDGHFIKNKGINDGKKIGYILEVVLLAKLNGKIKTFDDEKNMVIDLIRNC
jgi:tRNA nucleotidyltransferase (CCA-adding enzyme)